MGNMLSKMALSPCRRSLASQHRLSRDTNMELSAVLATSCATHTTTHTLLFAISRIRCAQRHNGNLLAVKAPDQQQHGTVRLRKSRVLSRKVLHSPQCARSQHGRGHVMGPVASPITRCNRSREWCHHMPEQPVAQCRTEEGGFHVKSQGRAAQKLPEGMNER